jgi:hypothetical protein
LCQLDDHLKFYWLQQQLQETRIENQTFSLVTTLAAQDASLHRSTIGNSLIRVDTLVRLLAVKVVPQELLDLRNPGASTNKDNLMNLALLNASILHGLLDRSHGLAEQVVVQLLKPSTGQWLREIGPIEEGLNLYTDLVLVAEGSLGTLSFPPQLSKSTVVLADVLAVLLLDQLDEVLHDSLVKVLT